MLEPKYFPIKASQQSDHKPEVTNALSLYLQSVKMRKKIDNRIRVMIENGVAKNERSMFVIVGDHGRDQVSLHHHSLYLFVNFCRKPNPIFTHTTVHIILKGP